VKRPWARVVHAEVEKRRRAGAGRGKAWFTEEEKAILDELAKSENVTLSRALREGAQLYFVDARDWIEKRRGDAGEPHAA
jgi:hypothetical protein